MLCISMKVGDYFTIGSDTVVQFDRLSGERVLLNIQAPRQVPILRGEVLERGGGHRPACVLEKSPRYVRQLPWDHEKKMALVELRSALTEMGDGPEPQRLRQLLDRIFPWSQGGEDAESAAK